MRAYPRPTRALLAAAAFAAIACAPAPDAPAADSLAAAMMLDSATIDSLKGVYPELTTQPVAAPRPPAVTPAPVPPRVRDAAPAAVLRTVRGEATYYADKFEGRKTASGIPFRQNQMVAAHRGFPFGTVLRVTNLRNDRAVTVRVVDRGPWGARAEARNTIIDLSRRAANQLGYVSAGRTPVQVEVLEWGRGV